MSYFKKHNFAVYFKNVGFWNKVAMAYAFV